jgi:DNA mismatch endonuclease (patch repair protein)
MHPRMAMIPTRDTKPELALQAALRRIGSGGEMRFHDDSLPGSPDIALPRSKTALFVHGCFWHHHQQPHCTNARIPTTDYPWQEKFARNRQRDLSVRARLLATGWRVLWCWECAVVGPRALPRAALDAALTDFIEGSHLMLEIEGRKATVPAEPPAPG